MHYCLRIWRTLTTETIISDNCTATVQLPIRCSLSGGRLPHDLDKQRSELSLVQWLKAPPLAARHDRLVSIEPVKYEYIAEQSNNTETHRCLKTASNERKGL